MEKFNIDTTTTLIISVVILIASGIGFFIGLWFGIGAGMDAELEEDEWNEWLHCFQCEIEMPTKEKKGNLYCSNCGLKHKPSC